MVDEPYDEIMGPSAHDVRRMMAKEKENTIAPVRGPRMSASAPPPASFPPTWGQPEPDVLESKLATQRAVTLAANKAALREALSAEDDEPEYGGRVDPPSTATPAIRQEALRLMEVADERLGGYEVHRTTTGGFTGQPMRKKKAALSGLDFKASRKNVGSIYRNEAFGARSNTVTKAHSYDYDDSGVDVVNVRDRFASSRPAATAAASDNRSTGSHGSGNNWSDRYSIDKTLMAMSGGSVSNSRKYLDDMDERERRASRNLQKSSSDVNVFGHGFSFRSKAVFGKQGVTAENLQTKFQDGASLPPAAPAKSWQEQLAAKRRARRRYMVAAVAVLVFCIAVTTGVHTNKKKLAEQQAEEVPKVTSEGVPYMTHEQVTFYVTSDGPYDEDAAVQMATNIVALDESSSFFVHLGNIQEPDVTNCNEKIYFDVADLLSNSNLPTFALPGEDDWLNCPDKVRSLQVWYDNFAEFENYWRHDYDIFHMEGEEANFAFAKSGILFVGVHVVGGRNLGIEDSFFRDEDDISWIKEQANKYRKVVRSMVIFGNARPGGDANIPFFDDLAVYLRWYGKPTLYVHANNDNGGLLRYHPYADLSNVHAIQTIKGESDQPLKISVGFGDSPFTVQ